MKQIRLATLVVLLALGGLLAACEGTSQKLPQSVDATLVPVASKVKDDATTGAMVRSTRQAQQTADAESTRVAGRTATQAAFSASATARVQQDDATAAVMARITGQAVLSVGKQWRPTLTESFVGNALEWPLGVTTDRSPVITSTISNGRYQWAVMVRDSNSYINLVPQKSPIFSAFSASVSITFDDGPENDQTAYGLVFRQVGKRYGFLGISRAGMLRILEVHDSGIYAEDMESLEGVDVSIGKTNELTVIAIGPDFVFLINDKVVAQTIMELAPGKIGLGADALTRQFDQAKVSFSNFQVSEP